MKVTQTAKESHHKAIIDIHEPSDIEQCFCHKRREKNSSRDCQKLFNDVHCTRCVVLHFNCRVQTSSPQGSEPGVLRTSLQLHTPNIHDEASDLPSDNTFTNTQPSQGKQAQLDGNAPLDRP